MSVYTPNAKLRKIRKELGLTQERIAAELGVAYPYYLSIETGQRKLSVSLGDKIAKTFGVANIRGESPVPLIRDRNNKLVPFTKERYLDYLGERPSFFLKGGKRLVRPAPFDYGRSVHALLQAAEEQGTIGPMLADLFDWFKRSISSNADLLESFQHHFERKYPGQMSQNEAFLALKNYWDDQAKRVGGTKQDHRVAPREGKRKEKRAA
jgi:transcriptional regulator with XRE-family HTH domain